MIRSRSLLLAVVVMGLSLGSVTAEASDPQRFVIYGDCQKGHEVHRSLVSAMVARKPLAAMITGDCTDNGFFPGLWSTFREIVAPLRAACPVTSAAGNHEYHSPLYFKEFGLDGGRAYRSVVMGDVAFFLLDSDRGISVGDTQYRWLEKELAANAGRYKILAFHHPILNSGNHGEDSGHVRDALMPLIEKHDVRLVFSGHAHDYEHLVLRKTHFVVNGGGGGSLKPMVQQSPYSVMFQETHHFIEIEVAQGKATVRAYKPDMTLIETFSPEDSKLDPPFEPGLPTAHDRVTIWSPGAGRVLWSFGEKQLPDPSYWPRGSRVSADLASVETPLSPETRYGRHKVVIGPFDGRAERPRMLRYRLGFADGSSGPEQTVPLVCRTVWPVEAERDDVITIHAERPGVLRWGVNGWERPDRSYWPEGTVASAGSQTVETPFSPARGRRGYEIRLGPLDRPGSRVARVDFVIRHADGSWGASETVPID